MYSRYWIEQNCILLTLTGSRMYNMHTSSSDYDWRGIFARPMYTYLSFEQCEQKDGGWDTEEGLGIEPFSSLSKDTVIYDLKKFLHLANKGNPNIIELLFSHNYVYLTDVGKELIKIRKAFLNESCKRTYIGYAYSQLKRMENHRKWLLNPPTIKPEPENYGFCDSYPILSKADVLAFCEFLYDSVKNKIEYLEPTEEFRTLLFEKLDYKALFKTYEFEEKSISVIKKLTGVDDNLILKVQNSKKYYNDLKYWLNYQNWKAHRNPQRAAMEAKCGYDVKHATHCLRLLYQALGIFEEQHIEVNVDDLPYERGNFLRKIKAGEVPYKEVEAESTYVFEKLNAINKKILPKPLTPKELSHIFIKLVELHENG